MKYNLSPLPCILHIKNEVFICDFDHKSIDLLQTLTGKGFYELYDSFINKNNHNPDFLKNLLTVSVYKNHGAIGLKKISALLKNNLNLSTAEFAEFKLLFKNLLPDVQSLYNELKLKQPQKSTEFYNFDEIYATARVFLKWSDTEFWSATPKKFCFALISFYKFHFENEKFKEELKLKYGLDTLKTVNKILS
ncbi:MAG: hypothetical protein K6C94_06990 [Candidatus Gastranaerophilales bacterium]|nr:hypothetical protein [Candidatus Gastranaerophilales bacterium]